MNAVDRDVPIMADFSFADPPRRLGLDYTLVCKLWTLIRPNFDFSGPSIICWRDECTWAMRVMRYERV